MDQQTEQQSSIASSSIQPYVMTLDQSAHLDWDWIRSFGQNFWYGAGADGGPSGVQTILDKAIANLQSYPRGSYYYTVCEMSFLRKYLEENPDAATSLQNARDYFQVVGGGITSPDCQVCGGEAFIRNYLVGHVWLSRALPHVPPRRVCWIPDDFGQGPELPVLLQALGFDGVGFARLPGSASNTTLRDDLLQNGFDFVWRASDGSEVIAHWVGALYPVGDRLATEDPVTAIESFVTNVYQPANQPQQYQGAATPAMYIPIDDDFSLPVPDLPNKLAQWGPQQQSEWNLRVQTGTFDGFIAALLPTRTALEVRKPYNGTPYWTGYFASRPELKIQHYAAMRALVAAEIIAMMTQPGNLQMRNMLPTSFWDDVAETWDDFTSSTHHDYICGTASDSVYATEQLPRLQAVAQRAQGLRAAAVSALAANTPSSGGYGDIQALVVNALGYARQGLAEIENVVLPGVSSVSVDGGPYTPVQIAADGGMLFQTPAVPSFGYVSASLSVWQQPQAGPTAEIVPQATGANRYVLRNDQLTATVDEDADWALVSVIDNATGDDLFSTGTAPGNGLVFYRDDGDIYRFGNEYQDGRTFEVETDVQVTTSGPGLGAVVLESGPLRVRLRTTVLVTVGSGETRLFTRDYTLVAGEPFLRMSTTGAAPLGMPGQFGYSVMTRFSLASDVATITHGTTGHWTTVQPLDGLWNAPVFRATHDFLIPQDSAGRTLCAIYHQAVPAWAIDGHRDLIGCLLRNTPRSGEGAAGTDPAPHTQHYALRVPSNLGDPSTAEPLREALAYNTPLLAVEVPAGDSRYTFTGMSPACWSVASVQDDATAILTVAKPGSFDSSKLVVRLYQPSNTGRVLQVKLGGGTPSSVSVVTAAEAPWAGPNTPVTHIVDGFQITMNAAIATVQMDGLGLPAARRPKQ
jgi:alpha-mannosidase